MSTGIIAVLGVCVAAALWAFPAWLRVLTHPSDTSGRVLPPRWSRNALFYEGLAERIAIIAAAAFIMARLASWLRGDGLL